MEEIINSTNNYLNTIFAYIKDNHMTRRRKKQKESFRGYIKDEMSKLGYTMEDNKGYARGFVFPKKYHNLISNNHDFKAIVIAHYDTPNKTIMLKLVNFAQRCNIFGKLVLEKPILNILTNLLFLLIILMVPFLAIYFVFSQKGLDILQYIFLGFGTIAIIQLLCIPNKNNYNDNTSGILTLFAIAEKLKDSNFKNDILFVFADNEERHLIGSKGLAKDEAFNFKDKPVINIDCVAIGNIFITSYIKADNLIDKFIYECIRKLQEEFKNKNINSHVYKNLASSDYKSFNKSKAISLELYKKTKFGYSIPNAHTENDRSINLNNIELIANGIVDTICSGSL